MPNDQTEGISRREALKRAAILGAAAWTIPAVQTINMRRAYAGSPGCTFSHFRIEGGRCQSVGSESCLPANSDPNSCDPINTTLANPISTPDGAEWVICLDAGCVVEGVGLKSGSPRSAGGCLYSGPGATPLHGAPVSNATLSWEGWSVDANGCLHIPRMLRTKRGVARPIDNSHADVVVCCP